MARLPLRTLPFALLCAACALIVAGLAACPAYANGGYGGGDDVQVFEQSFAPQFAPATGCAAGGSPQQFLQAAPSYVQRQIVVQRAPQVVYQQAPQRIVVQRQFVPQRQIVVQQAPQVLYGQQSPQSFLQRSPRRSFAPQFAPGGGGGGGGRGKIKIKNSPGAQVAR